MYNILLKMKTLFKKDSWLKMVDQAKEKEKITDEEYNKLLDVEK